MWIYPKSTQKGAIYTKKMISTAVNRAFIKGRQRKWKEIFVAIDIHDTIVVGNYSKAILSTEYYPDAKEALKYISERDDLVLILYTCSHPEELIRYQEFYKSEGINFKYANENPGVVTQEHGLGNYDKKMYFDLLLEDKAGFEPETDWKLLIDTLKQQDSLQNQEGDLITKSF